MTTTHYDALGVSPAADTVVITAAYRAMMRKHHPDLNQDPSAEATAKSVTAAFDVLADPGRRAAYDRALAEAARERAATPPQAPPGAVYWPEARRVSQPSRGLIGGKGGRAVAVLALLLALGAGGFGLRSLLAGGGGAAMARGAAATPQSLFAFLHLPAAGPQSGSAPRVPGCTLGLGSLWRLPGELKNSFGDLSQILKAAPAAGDGDVGGMKVIRIAPTDPCASRPPRQAEAAARGRSHGSASRSRALD